jgi:MFS family permease
VSPQPAPHSPAALTARWQRQLTRLAVGDLWTQVPAAIQHNLRWFWFDGVFARASEVIVSSYQSLFMLALGANAAQIGLTSSLSNVTAALLLLPGAAFVERFGHRKDTVVVTGGVLGRIVLMLLALLPFMFSGQTAIALAIALIVLRSAMSNVSLPAWVSLTADMVPRQWRGRYFSFRNLSMEIVGMISTFVFGYVITHMDGLGGYQLALAMAFAIGMGAAYSFARLDEPPMPAPAKSEAASHAPVWREMLADRNFIAFCATAAMWNFSLNIAGPFFNVYLVQGLRADATMVGLLAVIASLAALPGQRLWGRWVDRWTPYRVQLITGLLIPFMPAMWALFTVPWQIAPLNVASGFLWAGYELAAFNLLLVFSPPEHRARYSAVYQIVITVALSLGGALGGVIVTVWGYAPVFILSGVGRMCATLFFMRFVRSP